MKFNEAVKKIEEISKKLDGNIELEEGIKLFGESVELTKICAEKINDASGKIYEISGKLDEICLKETSIDDTNN